MVNEERSTKEEQEEQAKYSCWNFNFFTRYSKDRKHRYALALKNHLEAIYYPDKNYTGKNDQDFNSTFGEGNIDLGYLYDGRLGDIVKDYQDLFTKLGLPWCRENINQDKNKNKKNL